MDSIIRCSIENMVVQLKFKYVLDRIYQFIFNNAQLIIKLL